ncbi:hypothetical protein IVB30_20250 [Bradyrhizobium sp. 200]|uniref:LamG-like jellyroll fold domain-containing protein n=1 Tax=Bradyrhizobium sp. 200 TaxID=2782665 RepID=UPI0020001963|nr:LamG-like jellyroll fold domain-containing protein [Bradyrhizobium sp. 200]UPJ53440.1 hypothetical protein IVB30_20250 [Bradyrhizobium sp. 200]
MTELAARTMAQRLSLPFARGGDTMVLTLTDATSAQAKIAAYDFREHIALFGRTPEPRYALLALSDFPLPTTVTVDYETPASGGDVTPHTATIDVPPGTPAGTTFLLDLKTDEGPTAVLRTIRLTPPAPSGTVAAAWRLTALMGNIAKLMWVIGAERNLIREQMRRVSRQRYLPDSVRNSLDLLGSDLGVPRFPPMPYFFDEATIAATEALYHLDDVPAGGAAEVDGIENAMARYPGKAALPASNAGRLARSGVAGRFGTAFAFQTAGAQLEIAHDARLNVAVTDNFTWECFVKPDSRPAGADTGAWHLLRKHADPANATKAGFALSLGEFGRGLPINARLLLSDGVATNQLTVFADIALTASRFYHVAGVIDRGAREARIYVDGTLCNAVKLNALGAVTNSEKFLIGSSATASFRGAIDEVRLSKAAFTSFHPAIGESDASYRRRLRLFERWILPTRANLELLLNEAAGRIGGDAAALVVDDADATVVGGDVALAILPVALAPGTSIDGAGNRHIREADVNGTPASENTFDPVFLSVHNDSARVTYAAPPPRELAAGEQPPDSHKMQMVLSQALNRLLDLLGAPGADRLVLQSAFDPRAPDLRAVGRGMVFKHTSKPNDQLAALTHRAGFSFVQHRADLNAVYASVAPTAPVAITVVGGAASSPGGFDLQSGDTITLRVLPPLPTAFRFRWSTVPGGAGQAKFTSRTDRDTVTLQATAPGAISIKAEAIRRERTVSATLDLRAGLAELPDQTSIGADGTLNADASIAGPPDDFFHPVYLTTVTDARAVYGADPNTRRMQPSLAKRFVRLLDLIAATAAPGSLTVTQGYMPGATGPAGQGRMLLFSHASPQARLGALAHAAGFTYVKRSGTAVEVRQAADQLLTVSAPETLDEAATSSLTLAQRAAPNAIALRAGKTYTANRGTDSVSEIDATTGTVLRAFKVGRQPVSIVISPDGKNLYTTDSAGNSVTRVTLENGDVKTVAVGAGPVALVAHPAQPRLFVACQQANTLIAIDANTMAAAAPVAVGNGPISLAISSDGKEIWVALATDKKINIVSTTSAGMPSLASIALTDAPFRVVMAPDSKRAYVSFPSAGRLQVFDVAARSSLTSMAAGVAPAAMAADSAALVVVDRGAATTPVEQLRLFTTLAAAPFLKNVGTVRVRRQPADVNLGNGVAYVANAGSDEVSVATVRSEQINSIATWRLGSGLGERLTWIIRAGNKRRAILSSNTDTAVTLRAETAGQITVRAVNVLPNGVEPYAIRIRLKANLQGDASVLIRKDQYDVIMNILNAFRPVGIEMMTRDIREHVIELRAGLLNAFPDYADFRHRGPVLRRPERKTE